MKITIYTTTECKFSKLEKEYFASHGLQFEEKNLETNREFLTEMLAVGGNFAGTPVTKIEKDDGQIVVLKGFTPAEFDKTLGNAPKAEPAVATTEVKPVEGVAAQPTAVPVVETTPAVPPVAPEVPQTPAPVADPAMASVLNTLEQQAQVAPPAPVEQPPVVPAAPIPGAPVIPDPQF